MSDTASLDNQLNQDILSGKVMEAFEQYYADDVVMQENSYEPRKGKGINRKFEMDFFASVEEFHGSKLLASALNGDVSFSQWEFDITFKQFVFCHGPDIYISFKNFSFLPSSGVTTLIGLQKIETFIRKSLNTFEFLHFQEPVAQPGLEHRSYMTLTRES